MRYSLNAKKQNTKKYDISFCQKTFNKQYLKTLLKYRIPDVESPTPSHSQPLTQTGRLPDHTTLPNNMPSLLHFKMLHTAY